jgi:hypothetical protein
MLSYPRVRWRCREYHIWNIIIGEDVEVKEECKCNELNRDVW